MHGLQRGLISVAALALMFGGLTATASASPNANPYNPAYQHSYRHGAVPMRGQAQKMASYDQAHPNAVAAANTLAYGGGIDGIGVTSGTPEDLPGVLGLPVGHARAPTAAATSPSATTRAAARRTSRSCSRASAPAASCGPGTMTQYCDGSTVAAGATSCPSGAPHVGYPSGGAFAGVWYDNSAAEPIGAPAATRSAKRRSTPPATSATPRRRRTATPSTTSCRRPGSTRTTTRPAGSAPGTTTTATAP